MKADPFSGAVYVFRAKRARGGEAGYGPTGASPARPAPRTNGVNDA